MANWLNILGGVGSGATLGLQDIRAAQEAELRRKQMEQEQLLRALQVKEAQDLAGAREEIKGLQRPGTRSYAKALEQYGAGDQQARMLAAQTEEFGQEGADATASALAGRQVQGLQPRLYTDAAQARDIANIYQRRGLVQQAAQMSDRADTLGDKAREKAFSDFVRKSAGMSDEQFYEALAKFKTDDDTEVNATVYKDPTGQWTGVAYRPGFGQAVIPFKNRQEAIDLVYGSLNPKYYEAARKMQQGDRQVGAQEVSAGAAARNAAVNEGQHAARILSGYYDLDADRLRAAAEKDRADIGLNPARAALMGAQAAAAGANAEESRAKVAKLTAEAESWENKLPESQKLYLGFLNKSALDMEKAAAADPAYGPRAQMAKYHLFSTYKEMGAPGEIDPYKASGIPRPEAAADSVVRSAKGKLDSKTIDLKVEQWNRIYPGEGPKLRQAILGMLEQSKSGSTTKP